MALTHVYDREVDIDPSKDDSLSVIFSKISENSLVLDVGAGSGALGRALKKHKQCRVHGISYNPDEVEILRQHYDLALQVDLEQHDLPTEIKAVQYDYVVCADVLEHLKNAQLVLRRLVGLLKPGGRLVFSVPNVSHVSIMVCLLNGRFPRTHEGLLDSTHVNFFERSSLAQFCKDAGVSVVDEDAVYRDLARTEFSELDSTGLPPTVQQYVEQLPDAGLYQFIWTVQPTAEAASAMPLAVSYPARPQFEVRSRFEIKVYLDFGQGFNEDDISVGYGLYAEGVQDVVFEWPVNKGPLLAWRMDWPHWQCVVEFVQLDCRDAQGRELLRWNGSWSDQVRFDQCSVLPDLGENGFPMLLVSGKNASIEMRLLESLSVHAMNLRMGSPFRLPMDLEDRLLKRANHQRGEFDKVQAKLGLTQATLGMVQDKQAVLEEHLRFISQHTVTGQDQKYYWSALNERLGNLERTLAVLKDENVLVPKLIRLAFRRIKGWWRGQ
jgi:2-polyprenyl-3-methyl-5-hydroxy-6-metoxy-1,4-benzoquinol methylase